MLIIKYVLNIFRLATIIFCSSYFLGVFWLVLCEYQEYFQDKVNYDEYENVEEEFSDRFLVYFNLIDNHQKTQLNRLITVTYFSFTTLSTVGFGDYHPRSDNERLYCAFILLFGVAIFSLIMGKFTEIVEEFKNFNKEIDFGDDLIRFFGLIVEFNNKNPMSIDLRQRIEAHFDYKWKNDKN